MAPKQPTKHIWKTTPVPCEAQKQLDKMFEENKISSDDTGTTVYSLHPEFQKFDISVFRNHFDRTRQKYGLDRKLFKNACVLCYSICTYIMFFFKF